MPKQLSGGSLLGAVIKLIAGLALAHCIGFEVARSYAQR